MCSTSPDWRSGHSSFGTKRSASATSAGGSSMCTLGPREKRPELDLAPASWRRRPTRGRSAADTAGDHQPRRKCGHTPTPARSDLASVTTSSRHILIWSSTGPGIPLDRLGRIFDRFETGVMSDGIGLGLNIVQLLVARMNGTVRCVARTGPGARFESRCRCRHLHTRSLRRRGR